MSVRSRRLPEQGHTLIEVVAASVPLALIALSLFAAFKFTLGFSRRVEVSAEAVQQARLALHVIASELREASAASGAIVIWSRDEGAVEDGVGFLSARMDVPGRPIVTDANGKLRWDQAVYFLHDQLRGELRRFAGEATAFPAPSPPAEGRLMARHVKHLRLERQRDIVTITLIMERPLGRTVLETAVRPRN